MACLVAVDGCMAPAFTGLYQTVNTILPLCRWDTSRRESSRPVQGPPAPQFRVSKTSGTIAPGDRRALRPLDGFGGLVQPRRHGLPTIPRVAALDIVAELLEFAVGGVEAQGALDRHYDGAGAGG